MSKNEELQAQSQLARVVAATLDIKVPAPREITFRATLLRKAIAEIPTIQPSFLIRLFESACAADFPDSDIIDFRIACERAIATHLNLAAHKAQPKS